MTANHEPLVSIVTPVYNSEAHLRECIESVLAQTYQRWDYTIVNNCSTDATLGIAKEYAAKDPRIRVITTEHFLPVLESHNAAFRQVSKESKYCKVLGGDDWLYPECIEKMVCGAESHPNVAIVGSFGFHETTVTWQGLPYTRKVVPGREVCREYLLGISYFFGTPTSVLYRSELVRSRHAFFNEANIHADSEVCLEFLENRDFCFVHQILSFSRVRENSVSAFARSFNTYLPYGVYILLRYGPRYLNEKELKRRIQEKFADYYNYLGAEVYRRRGPKFWEYHREKLQDLGFPLSKLRLGSSAFAYGLNHALNPKSTLEAMARRLNERFSVF
jgi:glycosyltransferase involved in cell wall biosynthesis